jgi:ribosomal protein L11 methyltransferase
MSQPAPIEPRYPYVHVDVPQALADEMSAELFELGATGVEERDQTTLIKGVGGGVTLVASFDTREEADEAVAELDASYNPRVEEVVGDAWRDEWKKYFKPFDLCEGIVVRPPWEPLEETRGWHVLELEPGRAFGTGLHETTSLVAQALQAHATEFEGKSVLDVGCGSGILALVALKMGAAAARAVDNDPAAVDVTRENAERNGMASQVEADTMPVGGLPGTYPVVVANIEARVLVPLAQAIGARVAPGGLLVLSGVLVWQKEEVRAAYGRFELLAAPEKGEWTALLLRAPS